MVLEHLARCRDNIYRSKYRNDIGSTYTDCKVHDVIVLCGTTPFNKHVTTRVENGSGNSISYEHGTFIAHYTITSTPTTYTYTSTISISTTYARTSTTTG